MRLQWKNHWMHHDWADLKATTLREAAREVEAFMPYSEDGSVVRDADTGQRWQWKPGCDLRGDGSPA